MQILKNFVKYNKVFYKLYFYLGSIMIRILKLFYHVHDNYILFIVYGGQRYDDSPKEIYEYMKKDHRFQYYTLFWAFIEPDDIIEVKENKTKVDTLDYYKTAVQCKYWITNSSAERGLNFMPKNTTHVFFTHGMTGIKKIGRDVEKNGSFKTKKKKKFADYIVIEGKQEEEIIKRAWELTDEKILNVGLPRNDELVKYKKTDIENLKRKLKIPFDKKVILYAPTFREYKRDSKNSIYLAPPFDFDAWYKELGKEYILLLTAHYEVTMLMNVPEHHPFIINAFKYPHINDLMVVSDLLISDYSSILFDYSILEKPILSYAYDYDTYKSERGIYDGYESLFFNGILKTEEEVINAVLHMNYEEASHYTKQHIKEAYISNYGDATEKVMTCIFNEGSQL